MSFTRPVATPRPRAGISSINRSRRGTLQRTVATSKKLDAHIFLLFLLFFHRRQFINFSFHPFCGTISISIYIHVSTGLWARRPVKLTEQTMTQWAITGCNGRSGHGELFTRYTMTGAGCLPLTWDVLLHSGARARAHTHTHTHTNTQSLLHTDTHTQTHTHTHRPRRKKYISKQLI